MHTIPYGEIKQKEKMDLTFSYLSIAPEITLRKGHDLGGSNKFPIFLRDEREITIKQQKR